METQKDTTALIQTIVERAKKTGADEADAIMVEGTNVLVRQRLGKPETVERAESKELGLRVMIKGDKGFKQAMVSTNDLSEESVNAAIARAVEIAKAAPADAYAGLAPAETLAKHFPELHLHEADEPSEEKLKELASACEEAALAVDGVSNSEGAEASFAESGVVLATSQGFAQGYKASSVSLSASVIAGEGTKMETDYDYAVARKFSNLRDAASVGKTAAQRAVQKLNPQKVKTTQCPVIFESRVARDLLGSFAGAVNGASIARGTSFLLNDMGKQVFAKNITIVDDPLRESGLASRPFDGEGVAVSKRNVIEDGKLTTWFLDVRSANKLGLETTGHASRGVGSLPRPSSSNLYMEAGSVSVDDLIADIKSGFFVTEAFGMGVNDVTGDYSQGASGFWIENGKIAFPVSELTIAGNLKGMFASLTPADDLEFNYGINMPSVRIEGMTVAGA